MPNIFATLYHAIFLYPITNLLIIILSFIPNHDLGIAIILTTSIIRIILWPFQRKQIIIQQKMAGLQSEIQAIKKEAKGDRQKESQAMMMFYKEKKISPFSSCLPTILQIPLLLSLFFVFRSIVQDDYQVLNHLYPFVKDNAFISNIFSTKAHINTSFLGLIDLAKPSIVLAIMAGLTQFLQTRIIHPKQTNTDKNDPQAMLTKQMMYMLPLLTIFFGAKMPSSLSLYWTTSTTFAVLQTYLIHKYHKEKVEDVVISVKKGE